MPAVPTAAERVRSTLLRPGRATLSFAATESASPLLHHLLPDGSLALLIDGYPLSAQPAMLEIIDELTLPAHQPIRTLTWITGLLETMPDAHQRALALQIADDRPHPALLRVGHDVSLLRLRPISAVLVDTHAATEVSAQELAFARPDPFCLLEDAWLSHLEQDHAEMLAGIARHLPATLRQHPVRPLAIDRHGLSLRVETSPDASTDVRLPFATVATNPAELSRAVRALAGLPFHGGLRARHDAS